MAKRLGGRWDIEKVLDEGGQAHVFLVWDQKGVYQQPCVLKRAKNPKRFQRFKDEIRALMSLSHPNIQPVYDTGEDEGRPYYVAPYHPAGSLEKHKDRFRGDVFATLRFFRRICEAVAYAHHNQPVILHRDLKPGNILITEKSEPIVADFGLALFMDTPPEERRTETDEPVGPFAFMAPELEGGRNLDVDARADLYPLGKLLYYLLSGGVVLPRERYREPEYDLEARFTGRPFRLFNGVLDRTIREKPEERFESVSKLIVELDQIEAKLTQPERAAPDTAELGSAVYSAAVRNPRVRAWQDAKIQTERKLQYLRQVASKAAEILNADPGIERLREHGDFQGLSAWVGAEPEHAFQKDMYAVLGSFTEDFPVRKDCFAAATILLVHESGSLPALVLWLEARTNGSSVLLLSYVWKYEGSSLDAGVLRASICHQEIELFAGYFEETVSELLRNQIPFFLNLAKMVLEESV